MDKNDKVNQPDSRSFPWGIVLGFLGTVLVAYFGYLGIVSQTRIPIQATQTAEARLTLSANVNPSQNLLSITETPELTPIPSATSLPGTETVPLDTLRKSKPWLPIENTARPGSYYFLFNLSQPPFTNVLVRRAFAAAIDREAIVRIAKEFGATNPRPATTLTPPETLGRDLYDAVGISFDPANARQLLAQAGYTSVDNYPRVTLMVRGADEVNVRIGEEMIRMWQIYLGVTVTLENVSKSYYDHIQTDPSEIFFSEWTADYNDPDDFLAENFHTGNPYNYNHFANNEFDQLLDTAKSTADPAVRQELYIQAERILCEKEVALIPIYHATYNIP